MVCLTHDYFSYMKLTIFTSVDSASSPVTDWTPMQKLLAGDFIRSLDPTSPNPTFTPEASLIVDQYIYCRQWLLRAGHPLSSTHNAHDDAWLQLDPAIYPDNILTPESYGTSPRWDVFNFLYTIASGEGNWQEEVPSHREIRAIEGARGELSAGLESAMTIFKVLLRRQQLFSKALECYDGIIADMENGLLLI